jgi:hypothetical protein
MARKNAILTLALICVSLQTIAQPASFAPKGVGGGGAMFFPRINPANENDFYVACDMSEMFHSTDYGNTYSQMPFSGLQTMDVSTYEFTSNPLIAYSNYNDGNNGYPVKTTDGGNTWTMLPGYDATQGQVYAMKANYNNPNQVLLDYYGKIVLSNDGGVTFPITVASSGGQGAIMGGVFFDGLNIYIGTNLGLYHSSTGGATFSLMTTTGITAGQVIWQFAGAKAGGITRFCCITGLNTNVYNGLKPYNYSGVVAGVYTMYYAGGTGTWVNRTPGITTSNDYVMYVGMAENDINTIYLGGHDNALGGPLVYKSSTGGTAWAKVFNTTGNANIITGWEGAGGDKGWGWGETVFGMSVAPNNSAKAMFGSFSDVHVTSDGGATWKQAYVKNSDDHPAGANTPAQRTYHTIGMENTTCWQVHWHSPSNMMSAFSDIGAIRSADSGSSWGFTYSGMAVNSVYRIAETPGGRMFAATSKIHDMYQSTRLKDAQLDAADASGNISYSTDGGTNWSLAHAFGHPVFWLAIDPNDSNKMYASVINAASGTGAAGGVWMTSNLNALGASTWVHLPNPPRTEGHPACISVLNDGKVLCTYSGHINTSGAFTGSSGVFLYNPATSTWADVSDLNMHYWTKDVVIDPSDATQSTWYACVFTHWGGTASGQGGLYKTTNRGTTWVKMTASIFTRATSIAFNPLNANQAYLTTETQGLWVSNNMGALTPTWSLVSSYPFRQPERVYFNPYNQYEMWVSSFGNGMKMGNLNTTTGLTTFTGKEQKINIYPNPVKNNLHIVLHESNLQTPIQVYDVSGRLVASIFAGADGTAQINTASWLPGIYMVYSGIASAKFIKE